MTDEANKRTVLEKLKEMLVIRKRGNSPDNASGSEPFYVFAEHFSKELGLTFDDLREVLLLLEKEHPGQIKFEAVGNLSTSPEILDRECIPAAELKMDKAYFRVRLSDNLVNREEANDTKPKVMVDEKGRVLISFASHKPVVISKKKSVRGALVYALGGSWGVPRSKDVVLEKIQEYTDKEPSGKQINTAMKENNRVLKKKKLPVLELEDERPDNTWILKVKE
jgi:hypothetical protein